MEANFGTATPRQRWALYCLTKQDYRNVQLSKDEASRMISDLNTKAEAKGSEKAKKQAVKTVSEFMGKEDMKQEFELVWKKDSKMLDWSVKNHSGFKLSDGKVIMLDKPHIETHFCFGWSTCGQGPEWEEACETHNDFWNNQAEWFATENIQKFDREFPLPDLDDICVLAKQYDSGNIWNYYWCREWRLDEVLSRVVGNREYKICKNEEDVDKIKRAIAEHKQTFVKRLNSYLKKYGTSKLKSWTYWIDE